MRPFSRPFSLSLAVLAVTVLAGCATPPPADDPDAIAEFRETNDPLEPTNRFFYQVNDALVSGWATGFLVGAAFLISAAVVASSMVRVSKSQAELALHEGAAVAG